MHKKGFNSVIDLVERIGFGGVSMIICDNFKVIDFGRLSGRVIAVHKKMNGWDKQKIDKILNWNDLGMNYMLTFKQTKLTRSKQIDADKRFYILVKNVAINYLGSSYCPIIGYGNVNDAMDSKINQFMIKFNEQLDRIGEDMNVHIYNFEDDADVFHGCDFD